MTEEGYSDDTVNAGAGDDWIATGRGYDVVDGGSGYDVLNLDFSSSFNSGVTSSLSNGNSGEYISGEGVIEFTNIEGINVTGSQYDDVLVAPLHNSSSSFLPIISHVDGGMGWDELVIDYSDNNRDFDFHLQSGNLNVFDYQTGSSEDLLSFNEIESFNITTGRGNNNINLNYNLDNYSDDTVDAGAGDDWIATGRGYDVVDGGSGYDVLNLDFSSSFNSGVTSSLSNGNSGEYISDEGVIEFTNIEGVNVIGSQYDDVLVAPLHDSSSSFLPTGSYVNGGMGWDELVIDYSENNRDFDFNLDSYGSLNVFDYQTGSSEDLLSFNEIESFNIITGRGNNNINLNYNLMSDDVIDTGTGDDYILASLGNDTIEGGAGNDTYFYELGHGIDIISDSAGENDTIAFGAGITLDNLEINLGYDNLTFNFSDSPEDRIIIKNNSQSLSSIENIKIDGQTFSVEEILSPQIELQTIGEFGKVSDLNHGSKTIQLDNSYENPVVFALPLSYNGGDPSIVRITAIHNNSFTAYLQEAEYKDGGHAPESFSYIVLEAGTWELENGALLDVGMVNTNATSTESWEDISFNANFTDTPVILSQVQTNEDSEFVRTRQNQASIDGFSLSMEEEEALKSSGHGSETVGWLAIDSGQGNWGELEYQASHTAKVVDNRGYDINFSHNFPNEPAFLASLASFDDDDSAGLRYQNLSSNQVTILLREDKSLDNEMVHAKEVVDFLALSGSGDLIASAYVPVEMM